MLAGQDVAEGRLPATLYGASTSRGFSCPKGNGTLDASSCLTHFAVSDLCCNMATATRIQVLGEAYLSDQLWAAPFKGQPWMLNRIVLMLDVHVRAQGSNGGFMRGIPNNWADSDHVWVGGPHRRPALNPLEGWGHTSLARAFVLTMHNMSHAAMLDVKIDNDNDPSTANVTRRAAYTQLFNMSLFYTSGKGGGATYCPNQNLGDAKGAFVANWALEFLAPSLAWTDEEVLELIVKPAIGLANISVGMWASKTANPVGGADPNDPKNALPPGNWVTVSPAGISLEAIASFSGGYSGGYSDIIGNIDDWAT